MSDAFDSCTSLKYVELREGERAFDAQQNRSSFAPMRQENTYRMLKKMGLNVYQQQDKIQIIHMKSGCIVDVSKFAQGCVSVSPDEKTIAKNTML